MRGITFLLICNLLLACGPGKTPSGISRVTSDSLEEHIPSDNIPPDVQPDCLVMDTAHLQEKMGMGVLTTTFRDSLIFYAKPDTVSERIIISLNDHAGWHLEIRGMEKEELNLFRQATELEGYYLIWEDSLPGWYQVRLRKTMDPVWLPEPKIDNAYFFTWEQYLLEARISTHELVKSKPAALSSIDVDSSGVFVITALEANWAQIAPLDQSDPSFWPDASTAIGWIPWYCHDSMTIQIWDDYMMESYYYQ